MESTTQNGPSDLAPDVEQDVVARSIAEPAGGGCGDERELGGDG